MIFSVRSLQHLLFDTLEQAITKGTLHVITPDKVIRPIGGVIDGTVGYWIIHDWKTIEAIIARGDIGLGESYREGWWDSPDLEALFTVLIDNIDGFHSYANGSKISRWWFRFINYLLRRNSIRGSKDNIRAHYDVGNDFYRLWLDPTMTYSSALYDNPYLSLEEAQKHKYQRLLDRIDPARKHILEIGCGWGGFANQATDVGHHVTGVTVSEAQYQFALSRLKDKADIRLQDYRHITGTFDAIASIEMFEAVGMRYWPTYFSTVKARLAKDGVAMLQTITIKEDAFDQYVQSSDYIRHYVFPGGMLPSVSAFKASAEKADLVCQDIFHFGQDYARTLREWLKRFEANIPAITQLGYGETFIRSWRLYLSMCAASFACGRTNVVQVELRHA